MPITQANLDRLRPVPVSGLAGDSKSWCGLCFSPVDGVWTLWSMTKTSDAWGRPQAPSRAAPHARNSK